MKILPAILAALMLLITSAVQGQVKRSAPAASLKSDLQKIIGDFNSGFSSIRGGVQYENPQTTEYASEVQLSGAEACVITQHSGARPMYSFEALMLTTEDFAEAAKKYKSLYGQLKGMTIRINNDYTYSLSGSYEAPDESKKFSSSVLRLLPAATQLPRLKVEVSLQYYFPEWKVSLLVYEKEREDRDRGKKEDDDARK